jgi:hypothetical protein
MPNYELYRWYHPTNRTTKEISTLISPGIPNATASLYRNIEETIEMLQDIVGSKK